MTLIIHHEQAWKAALNKYNIVGVDTPQSWPVLVNFVQSIDNIPVVNISVVSVEQAAKFLSVCSTEQLSKINPMVRVTLAGLITNKSAGIKTIATKPLQELGGIKAIKSSDGAVVTLSGFPPDTKFKVGQVIYFNGDTMIITAIDSPTSGKGSADLLYEFEAVDYTEMETIPGLQELPMDPSKLDDKKDKVADLGDVNEHVLDVERNV